MESDLTAARATIVDRIELILAATASEETRQGLAELEDTLTSGYAHALALEGERLRLERELASKVAELGNGSASSRSDEFAQLAQRISIAHCDIERLRGLLGSLRVRARVLRGDAPHAAA